MPHRLGSTSSWRAMPSDRTVRPEKPAKFCPRKYALQRQNDRETARLWQRPQIALYGPLRAISPAEPALPAVIRPFLRGCAAHHAIEAISVITRRAATERFAPRFPARGNFQIGGRTDVV